MQMAARALKELNDRSLAALAKHDPYLSKFFAMHDQELLRLDA